MMVRVKGTVKVDGSLAKSNVLWRYLDTAKFLDFLASARPEIGNNESSKRQKISISAAATLR